MARVHVIALVALASVLSPAQAPARAEEPKPAAPSWEKTTLSKEFFSEGAHAADLDKDGQMDIVAGGLWFRGPDFKQRFEYYPAKPLDPKGYSKHFLTYVGDVTGDGWTDIVVLGFPGELVNLYVNPANPEGLKGHWKRYDVVNGLDNESPTFTDLISDGKAQVVGSFKGAFGYWKPGTDPTQPWPFHPISEPNKTGGRFTHGLGVGDVNGDGRLDLLEKNGWHEQPASLAGDPTWTFHPFPFAPAQGGAQMYAYDVDGDGRNDVITVLEAHGYGLAWYQNLPDPKAGLTFKRHTIVGRNAKDTPHGVVFTQMHALALVDVDGDGLKDLVTGKRWWAHGPKGDPESDKPAVLYWFQLRRSGPGDSPAAYIPHLIDDDSGIGTQVEVLDVNGDKLPDVVVGTKKGVYVLSQKKG
jgi:hypothetical protein